MTYKIARWLSIPLLIGAVGLSLVFSLWYSGREGAAPLSLFPGAEYSIAGAADQMRGFAWSELYGWISFNSVDCDTDGNGTISAAEATAKPGCSAGIAHDYGVRTILGSTDAQLAGYAWSSNLGWIYFGPDNASLGTYGNIRDEDAPALPREWAKITLATGKVTGWAKILSIPGVDGWIKMSDDTVGVWAGQGARFNINTGTSSGWLWNGYSSGPDTFGVGWISLNARDCDTDGDGIFEGAVEGAPAMCPAVSPPNAFAYGVYLTSGALNTPPVVNTPTAVGPTTAQSCAGTVRYQQLTWQYIDAQAAAAYRIVVDTTDTGANPPAEGARDFDTNTCIGVGNPSASCTIDPTASAYLLHNSFALSYGTTYHWWINMRDSLGAWSDWVKGADFTITAAEYPRVDFDWTPDPWSYSQNIDFTSNAEYYTGATPNPCDAAHCVWAWTVSTNGVIDPAMTNTEDTVIQFSEPADGNLVNEWVRLTVTDPAIGGTCFLEESSTPTVRLPLWREVK